MRKTRPLFALFIAFSLLVGGVAAPVSFVYADEISSEDITDDNQNNEDQNHALVKSAGANGADPSSGEAGEDGGEDPSDDGSEDDSGTTGEKSDIDTVDDPLASDVGSDAATYEPSDVGADYGANEGGDTGSGRKAADASGVSEPDAAGSGEPSATTDDIGTKAGTDDSSGSASGASGKSAEEAEGTDGSSVSQDSADPDTITAIDPPEQEELTLEYKTSLEILFEDFPEKITIHKGDEKEEIDAKWVCRDDYNENLDEYVFVPDMEEYKLAPELELPTVTVRFTEEETGPVSGYLGENLEYDVPLAGSRRGILRKSGLPSSYSSYDEGKLPAVRRQSPYGTCWAFSLMGAVEADLIHDGTEDTDVDLSELHLAYYTSHDYDDGKGCHTDTVEFRSSDGYGYLDNGGNAVQAYRYLSNYVGAVQESSVRYSQGYDYDPGPGSAVNMNHVQIRNAYEISPSDTDNIKSAIMEHGGVAASYYETNGPNEFNSDNSAYYSTGKWYSNHAVMLVGWDDDFSREKFNASKRPSSNGAWLVRNSWGQNGFGHSGYFWLSYEDSGFINSDCVVAIDAELSEDMYDHCYAYDGQPIWDAIYYAGSGDTIRQTYDVDAGETIRAVSFEIGTANVTADVTVTDKETGDSIHTTCRTTYAGFHTAEFSEGLDIINDSEIEVAITYTSDDGGSVIIVAENTGARGGFGDLYYTGVCDRGFRIGDGTYVYPYDARMNLYTDDYNGSSSGIALKDGPDSAHWKETIQLELTDDSIVTDETRLTWTSSNERVATVDNKGLVTMGPYKGSARIKGEYTTDGGKRYVWRTVTVEPYHVTYMNLPADTFQNGMSDVFYPGDSANDGLFNAMRTSGYYVSAWYENASLSGSAISWHPTVCRDLVLYPKWTEMYLFIMYYVPNANLNGYNTYTRKSIKSQLGASKLPYTLPGAAGCECNPNDFTTEYNKTHAPKAFSYWSWDAAGKNKATQITSDILNITYSGGAYYLNLDAYLYPQYKETGQNVPVTGITLNKTSGSVNIGATLSLTATVSPSNAQNKSVTWRSSNTKIATVTSSGVVKGISAGTANITATTTDGGKTATCRVTVINPTVATTGVTISKTSVTLTAGQGITLTATVKPSNATNKSVVWTSNNPAVATVNASGYVKAVKRGKAVITVRTASGGKTAICTVTVNPSDKVEAFVTRLYRVVLEREPDEGGLAYWVAELKSGRSTGADVVGGFYLSKEMRDRRLSNSRYVELAYNGIMGRSPDSGGKSYWTDSLDSGASYDYVVCGFIRSQEFTDLCASYGIKRGNRQPAEARDKNIGITKYVSRLYTKALGRGYDADGLNYWCQQILNDSSRANVINVATGGFFHSAEFRGKNLDNGAFVKVLYRTFLGREYDQTGYQYWKGKLDSGQMSRDDVINAFAYSEEFSTIMAQYGL